MPLFSMTRRFFRPLAALVAVLCALVALGTPVWAEVPPEQMTITRAADGELVFHHLRRYEAGVELLQKEGPPTYRRVKSELGIQQMPPIDVWVVPQVKDYFELAKRPMNAPKWAVGLSFSGRHEIVVAHGGKQTPRQVLLTFSHELAHVAVDQARGARFVPRWFNEGFAVMIADEWTPERSERLSRAASSGSLIAFNKLSRSFPSHHQSASLAYDQSFHFVRWLEREYGADLFARVMKRISKGQGFQQALEAATETDFPRLEARWRQSLEESTTFWSILGDDVVIFFGAGLFFIIALVVARRRRNRQMASMEDDDADDWSYDAARYPLPGQQSQDKRPPDNQPPSG